MAAAVAAVVAVEEIVPRPRPPMMQAAVMAHLLPRATTVELDLLPRKMAEQVVVAVQVAAEAVAAVAAAAPVRAPRPLWAGLQAAPAQA